MPRAGWVKPSDDQRLTDHVALGVLTRTFPPWLIDAAIEATGKTERRSRLLPARLVVYYVMAMALFADASYEEVVRNLVEGLSYQSGWQARWEVPTKGAISLARARLGPEPIKECFTRACVPLATEATPGAFYRGWRLMAIDGTTFDVPDTAANDEGFGRPGTKSEDRSAFPQLRLVGLAECGTHAITGVSMGGYNDGENALAASLVDRLAPGMLVLADRGFGGSYELFGAFAATGAELCWRMKKNAVLPAKERYDDGSFRSELAGTKTRPARQVRVVEYEMDDPGRPQAQETSYRLATTILDPEAAPADELAGRYAERWEFETMLDEVKTHARGKSVVLRSKDPERVRQEVYGYLCTHYAIRALMTEVAEHGDFDPDRISFTRSLRAARRSVRAGVGTSATAVAEASQMVVAEITRELLPERRLRAAGRVVKRKMSNWGLKRAPHRDWAQPERWPRDAVRVLPARPS